MVFQKGNPNDIAVGQVISCGLGVQLSQCAVVQHPDHQSLFLIVGSDTQQLLDITTNADGFPCLEILDNDLFDRGYLFLLKITHPGFGHGLSLHKNPVNFLNVTEVFQRIAI